MNASSMEVSEIRGRLHPAVESAAMRFAAGYPAEARRVLEEAVAARTPDRRPWLMLLDLLRLEGRWSDYEARLGQYAAAFGDDPPHERERKRRESGLPEALRAGGAACIALAGVLDSTIVSQVARLRATAAQHTLVHLDVARLSSVEVAGVRLLHDTLAELLAAGNGIILSGHENLLRLLRGALDVEPTRRACWDLLLMVHRVTDDQSGFERAALEAALATNMPAPAWEPLLMPQAPPSALSDERRNEPRYSGREALVLTGVMAGAEDPQLAALDRFASERDYVNVDLSLLERLDFVCAAQLANRVSAMARAGRTVRLLRPNELVAALLELLNLGGVASIVTLPA